MADNNKVTIAAAYFNHLFARAAERERLWSDREGLILECEKIAKERDELKAKLEDAQKHYCTSATGKVGDACKVAALCRENEAKLAEAERCIETIASNIICTTSWENKHKIIEDAIRAYREKKEAK